MPSPGPLDDLRAIAATLDGIDVECYRRHDRHPHEPVLGLGAPQARWCFFGRDPGEQEVRLQQPFVGPAGQNIRAVLSELGADAADVYWMNTVPFKPLGNRPWSLAVRRRCRPPLLELLAGWQGRRVIAFGEAAFGWFGLGDATLRRELDAFRTRADTYEAELDVVLDMPDATVRRLTLCPVPHPSGANARWARAFPTLLKARLRATT
ncbi:uracil-DNA glycosylase family protein [Piscinibacter koreensis]|uniref:Uracil-DNA glycosylase family protein n=1 Tax=Piscinibacter koreensis TaxID=2742824 RepID=A0A7Y6NS71_9BURK|nr:uracil-DNA glycosylase family protein [Schlegelella koreensis]NUZ08323.1 uracil-DNA glycosylase family protein [Schlegelella koreensis]